MTTTDDAVLLAFVNAAPDSAALVATVQDDPARGKEPARTLPPKLAHWIVRARDELYGGQYRNVLQLQRVHGVGDGDVLADLRWTAARTQTFKKGKPTGRWTAEPPEAVRTRLGISVAQEDQVLAVINAASTKELSVMVVDDPAFGKGPPGAYGVRGALATWLVRVRDGVFGGTFKRLADVSSVSGVGSDTLHDIVQSILTPTSVADVVAAIEAASSVVLVTGAGVSLASLVGNTPRPTADDFQFDVESYWKQHLKRRDTATTAWPFTGLAPGASLDVSDKDAVLALHEKIATLASWCGTEKAFSVITQNQDRFHLRAENAAFNPRNEPGSSYVVELHGNLYRGRCTSCGNEEELPAALPPHADPTADPPVPVYFTCSADKCNAMLRPSTVWVGEPYEDGTLGLAGRKVLGADVVLFLGTSGRAEVIRWLLYEARFHARATTVVVDEDASAWAPYTAAIDLPITVGACAFMNALMALLQS